MSSLAEVIAERFQIDSFFTGNGNVWAGINCPFHQDDNASAGINFELKLFKCHAGCGVKNFRQLAIELNLDIDAIDYQLDTVDDWLKAFDLIKPPPKLSLKKQAKEYTDFLLERKLKPETIEEFGGWYCSDVTNVEYYGHLVVPYGKDKLHKRRIIKASGDNRFANSKGKDKGLFFRDLSKWDSVILCEGFTDFATLWQSEIRNIAASFGAEVSKKDLYLLRGKTVFILFDRDYAGYEGAKKALSYLKELGAIPIILEIPERFGNGDDKIDVNSAYVYAGDDFIHWVKTSVSRYNIFDSEYISATFLENKRTVKYLSTGISGLDVCLNGGFATGLHAIAGMPEAGKSTLITYLEDVFIQQEQRVLSLSYEITKEQKYARLASRVDNEHGWSDIEKDHSILDMYTSSWLSDVSKKLRIDMNWNINEIKAAATNFDVIIVDYIQRMPFEGNDERAGIKHNARELSNLTRDGKIVILISSIPRGMYDKTGKNVFKETGDIEYICQSGYILRKVTSSIAVLEMIKNTRGTCKDHYLRMDYAHQRIQETTRPELTDLIKE